MCKCHKYNKETKKFERVYGVSFKLNSANLDEFFKFDYEGSAVFQVEKRINSKETLCRNLKTGEANIYHNSAKVIFQPPGRIL